MMRGWGYGNGYGRGFGPGMMGRGLAGHGFLLAGPFMFLGLIVAVVMAFAFWRIFRKAGFEGVLGLLILIPVVNVAAILWLALADWPVLRELRHRRAADGEVTGPDHPAHMPTAGPVAPVAPAPMAAPAAVVIPAAAVAPVAAPAPAAPAEQAAPAAAKPKKDKKDKKK
jgi:hypothetical protein